MHRAQTLALLLAAGLLCSGCSSGTISSNYRPVEDLTLVQTIGVDRAPEGVCLSASTGRVGENEPPQRMTQTGETVLAALDRLQDRTPNAELFYAQTSYLLLGEEAAAAGAVACVRTPESEGGKLALAPAGYAIFRGGDYLGCIAPETARGASMLLGVVHNGDIAVRDGDGSTVMLTLDTCRAAIRPVWDGGTLARVDVTLRLRAGISELRTPRRITTQAYQDELNAALAACVGGWVRDALAASQALEADFLGVGQAVAVRSGHRWAAIRDGWAELWPDVPVRVTVDADVGRTYDLRDGIDTTGGGR